MGAVDTGPSRECQAVHRTRGPLWAQAWPSGHQYSCWGLGGTEPWAKPRPPLFGHLEHECPFLRLRGGPGTQGREPRGGAGSGGAENSEGDLPLVLWPQIWSRGEPRAVAPWDKGPLQLHGFYGSLDEGGYWGLKSPVPVRWPDRHSETSAVEAAHCPVWPWEPLME